MSSSPVKVVGLSHDGTYYHEEAVEPLVKALVSIAKTWPDSFSASAARSAVNKYQALTGENPWQKHKRNTG